MSSDTVRKFLARDTDPPIPRRSKRPPPDPNELVRNMASHEEAIPKPIKVAVSGKGVTSEELTIPWFSKKWELIKDRSVIFYGPSGSGKTVLIHDIMYNCKYQYPRVIVFAPTNREKGGDYEGIIPKELVYEEFGLEDIRKIYEHQKAAAHAYNTANNLTVLEKIFERIAATPQRQYVGTLQRQKRLAEVEIAKVYQDPAVRKVKRNELEEMHKTKLRSFYKKNIIKPNLELLTSMHLPADEMMAVKYVNFNPRVLIVFDDAMTEILTLIKKGRSTKDNVILDFFFKGRWAYITHFYAFQDDNRLDSEIKKNAFVSVFTAPNVASAFFGRAATNFSKQDKARADSAIKSIFSNDEESLQHRKLVFCRMDKNPFHFTIADLHDDFKMCSRSVRKYCESVGRGDQDFDKSNPYLKRFADL